MLNLVSRGRWRDTAQQASGPGPVKHADPAPHSLTTALAEGLNLAHFQGRILASLRGWIFSKFSTGVAVHKFFCHLWSYT